MLHARGYFAGLRRLGPDAARYFVGVALVGFAIDGGIYAVLLNLFLNRLSFGPEAIGTINAAGTLTFAVASLPAGLLGERWGSRQVMIVGLGLMAGCGLLLPLAELLPAAGQLAWLALANAGLYLGLALYFVNTAPLLLGFVPADQRNQAYATQTALLSLASFVGSLAGGLLPPLFAGLSGATLEQAAPYRYGLMVAGLALIPSMVAIARTRPVAAPEEPAPPDGTPAAAAAAAAAKAILGLLALIALVRTLQIAGLAATSTFFNLYLDSELGVPTAQIGLLIAVARLLGVPAALSTAALSARFGNRGVVIGASLGTAIGMLPLALIPHWGAAALSYMTVVSLSWIRYAASIVFFLELVPRNKRATVSGVTEMAAGVCFTALTFGGGFMIAALGYQVFFLLGAGLTALSALAFWGLFRGARGEKSAAA